MAIFAYGALAATVNTTTTPRPAVGNVFAVYPGWNMNIALNEVYQFLLPIRHLLILTQRVQATPQGLTEKACQLACSVGGCIFNQVYL